MIKLILGHSANNKDAQRPAHLCHLIKVSVVCYLASIVPLAIIFILSRLLSVAVSEQPCLSLASAQTPKTSIFPTWLI